MTKPILVIVAALAIAVVYWMFLAPRTVNDTPSGVTSGVSYCPTDPRISRDAICSADYTPVCATVQIQCIKAPCYPIQETFSNICNACKNPLVSSYVAGECK